jgi:hypothetical protein
LIKGKIHQEEITIVITYAINISTPNSKKKTLLDIKAQINPSKITLSSFNTPLINT